MFERQFIHSSNFVAVGYLGWEKTTVLLKLYENVQILSPLYGEDHLKSQLVRDSAAG